MSKHDAGGRDLYTTLINNAQNAENAKSCNFSFLFGASYKRFSQGVLEVSWTEERVREFVKSRNLEEKVHAMREKHPNIDEKLYYYYASSEYIRENFFKSYPGLNDRIKRNEEFAKEHGYIRSYHGGIRRTPLLMWCMNPNEIDQRTGKAQVRKDEDYKEMAGLINITANTSIQNDEVCDMNMAIVRWTEDPENKDDPIFGMVHDSSDFYILRDSFDSQLQKIKKVFEEKDDSWQDAINFAIEGAVVDFLEPDAYYKHGKVVIE
jgi:hypothetical protein